MRIKPNGKPIRIIVRDDAARKSRCTTVYGGSVRQVMQKILKAMEE